MNGVVNYFEVFQPVVGLDAVDVVNIFVWKQKAPERPLHDATVFLSDFPAIERGDISLCIDAPYPPEISIAAAATEHVGVELDVAGMAEEPFPALRTDEVHNGLGITPKHAFRKYGIAGLLAGGGAAATVGQSQPQQ
jgi:hypothetical protein